MRTFGRLVLLHLNIYIASEKMRVEQCVRNMKIFRGKWSTFKPERPHSIAALYYVHLAAGALGAQEVEKRYPLSCYMLKF